MSFRGQLIKHGLDVDGKNITVFDGYFKVSTANKVYFRDTGIYLHSSADGCLNITADKGIILTAPGRLSTGTLAGAYNLIDATTYQYTEAIELRYAVVDWVDTYTLNSFTAMKFALEARTESAGGQMRVLDCDCRVNDVTAGNIGSIMAHTYIKGSTAKTVAVAFGGESEVEVANSSGTLTITTKMIAHEFRMRISTAVAGANLLKCHGAVIKCGCTDGTTKTVGTGLLIENYSSGGGTVSWTKGLHITDSVTGITIGITTGAACAITGKWGTGLNTGAILIAADQSGTALALGSNAAHMVLERVNVTVQITGGNTFLGKYMTIASSGSFGSTGFIQGNYTSVTVAHLIQEVYGVRGKVAVTAAQAGNTGNQYIGMFAAVDISAVALALADTGGCYGILATASIASGGTCDQPIQAGYFDTCGIKANIAGETSTVKIRAGGGSDSYTDYALNIELESNNIVSAIHLATKTSCVCPVGIEFDTTSGIFTDAFKLADNGILASDSAASPLSDIQGTASTGFIRVMVGSATRYIALYSAN